MNRLETKFLEPIICFILENFGMLWRSHERLVFDLVIVHIKHNKNFASVVYFINNLYPEITWLLIFSIKDFGDVCPIKFVSLSSVKTSELLMLAQVFHIWLEIERKHHQTS